VSLAFEMETLILGWYVMVQTGSVLLLTAFGSLLLLGTLASPMFGVLGDRLGGRAMLAVMRAVYTALAGVVLLLASIESLTPLWVFVVATLAGIVRPNDQVMRNALIGETIPSAHLIAAVSLSRATMDSARIFGALAGAALSTVLGLGPTYGLITALYAASLALTFGIARRPPVPDPGEVRPARHVAVVVATAASRGGDLKDGLLYVVRTPRLLAMMWLAFLINLTAYPVSSGLLPYVARSVYAVDAKGLGWLAASFALGSLLGSIVTVVTGWPHRPERSMLTYTAIWYVVLLAFGHVQSLGTGLTTLFLAGFVQSVAMIAMTANLLAASDDRFRGRVMGVRTLAIYGMPLGLMTAGALIERIGYALTISVFALVGLLFTLLIGIKWRASLWQRLSLDTAPRRG
jgi:predicted MFS family arabinose efflux permease